jgi:hypothetical protein
MIAFFLLLVIVAIALGIIGVVAKGLLYLLIIGIVIFLGALILWSFALLGLPARSVSILFSDPGEGAEVCPGGDGAA